MCHMWVYIAAVFWVVGMLFSNIWGTRWRNDMKNCPALIRYLGPWTQMQDAIGPIHFCKNSTMYISDITCTNVYIYMCVCTLVVHKYIYTYQMHIYVWLYDISTVYLSICKSIRLPTCLVVYAKTSFFLFLRCTLASLSNQGCRGNFNINDFASGVHQCL